MRIRVGRFELPSDAFASVGDHERFLANGDESASYQKGQICSNSFPTANKTMPQRRVGELAARITNELEPQRIALVADIVSG